MNENKVENIIIHDFNPFTNTKRIGMQIRSISKSVTSSIYLGIRLYGRWRVGNRILINLYIS